MNKKLILMLLFSFLAHMAVAGVVIKIPSRITVDKTGDHKGKIVWGVLSGSDGNSGESGKKKKVGQGKERKISNIPSPLTGEGRGRVKRVFTDEGPDKPSDGIQKEFPEAAAPVIPEGQGQEVFYSSPEALYVREDVGCTDVSKCGESRISGGRDGRGSSTGIFLDFIRREIDRHKYYPPFARKMGIEGTVYIDFHIGEDGRLYNIAVIKSSGSKILDDSGISTIKNIKQFSQLPEVIRELDITVPIAYKLVEN